MKTTRYNARWAQPGQPTRGNVDFTARNDEEAKDKADRIAQEIGLIHTPRTIYAGNRCVEVLDTGRHQ